MTTLGGWDTWQVLDATGLRKYLSADERARFLRAADRLPRTMQAFPLRGFWPSHIDMLYHNCLAGFPHLLTERWVHDAHSCWWGSGNTTASRIDVPARSPDHVDRLRTDGV